MWIFFLIAAAAGVYLLAKKEEGTGTGAGGGTDPGRLGTTDTSSRPQCPTTKEIDAIIASLWAGTTSPAAVEAMAGALTKNLCPAMAAKLRDAVKSKAASSFTADPLGLGSIDLGLGGAAPTFGVEPAPADSMDPKLGWELAPTAAEAIETVTAILPNEPVAAGGMFGDNPLGDSVRSWVVRVLRSFDGWKRDLVAREGEGASFPFSDSDNLRSKASIIETTYGANAAGGRLRTIASAVDEAASRAAILDRGARQVLRAEREWPGLMAIDDSDFQLDAEYFASAFHKTSETITGSCGKGFLGIAAAACADDYSVLVLVPVEGVTTPSVYTVADFLKRLEIAHPTSGGGGFTGAEYSAAKIELKAILSAMNDSRVKGTYKD